MLAEDPFTNVLGSSVALPYPIDWEIVVSVIGESVDVILVILDSDTTVGFEVVVSRVSMREYDTVSVVIVLGLSAAVVGG